MQEEWKSVVGYEGYYSVSNLGRARRDLIGNGLPPKIVYGHKNYEGYTQISLCRDSKRKLKMIHRLVVESFLGTINLKLEVNHKDGNKGNNVLSNLEIVTSMQNNIHARATGLWKPRFGEDITHSKLNNEKVLMIRKMYGEGNKTYVGLAEEFGVKKSTIHKVAKRLSWKHI